MSELSWIVLGGVLMGAIAACGGVTAFMTRRGLERVLLPLVSLAAGSLLGGAFFHMMPEGLDATPALSGAVWMVAGFTAFLALEQGLSWHHSHRPDRAVRRPVTYLILLGDTLHNFIGGLGVAGTFLMDARAGMVAWLAAAAHELPQELGDFGILVHGGWPRGQALLWNVLSSSTFLLGGLLALGLNARVELAGVVLFAAGNFIYIAASDLIPEIKQERRARANAVHFLCFAAGLGITYVLAAIGP